MMILRCMDDWKRRADCLMKNIYLGEQCPSLYMVEFASLLQRRSCTICEGQVRSARLRKSCASSAMNCWTPGPNIA
jgi:hypothetical protein